MAHSVYSFNEGGHSDNNAEYANMRDEIIS